METITRPFKKKCFRCSDIRDVGEGEEIDTAGRFGEELGGGGEAYRETPLVLNDFFNKL